MCLKPLPPQPIPEQTAILTRPLFPEGTVYQFIGDLIFDQFRDDDFADLYPVVGQPSISPVLLSFLLIFKHLENLSDRATVYNLRMRLDWKYALHLPLSYASFDHTVLVEFRKRLLQHKAESHVFNAVFTQLKQLGFFQQRGIQRTDSLAIYSHCRELHRIELVVETMRVAIKELLHTDPDWTRATLPADWEERYARRCKSERMKEDERQALAVVVGDDGRWLLDRLEHKDAAHLRELRAVEALRDVWAVHYLRGEDGHMRWTADGERGGSTRIETPHDPDARWGTKRGSGWIGYTLQVTETDDPDNPHLITDIAITPAPASDMTALDAIRARQAEQDTLPRERYVDSGYVSGENITDGQAVGEDLLGPMRGTVTAQSKLPDGFTHADFAIDVDAKTVTCPNGETTVIFRSGTEGTQATFPAATCAACPLKARCRTGTKRGRTLRFGPHYAETQAARQRQTTDEFKRKYRAHRGGIEGCLSELVRGPGIRRTRYVGQAPNHLHALFAGAGVNLRRSARWRAGYRPKKYPPRLGLVVGGGGKGVTGATGAAGAAAVAMTA